MAYKKYITKNGKIYGPYVYHSKRVDGKVVSEYHGLKKDKKSRKKVLILIAGFILLFLMFWILFFAIQFSGRVVLDIYENPEEGTIKGSINLNLEKGELIPVNSIIKIENNEEIQEYTLKDLVNEKTLEGQFYLKEINFSGEGEGFGLEGEIEKTPDIIIKFKTIPLENNLEENETEEIIVTENTTEENNLEENETEEEVINENNTELTITGNAISNPSGIKKFFNIFTGKVTEETIHQITISKGKNYDYNLEEGETIDIIEVKTEEKNLPLNEISYSIENNKVTFSTNYSEIEKGFGEEFIEEDYLILKINFEDLKSEIKEGPIKIELLYDNKSLMNFGETISQKTIETEVVISEVPLEEINLELTTYEKQTLLENFGSSLVKTSSFKYKNKILIEFELASKSMQHYYDSRLSEEKISLLIEKDKTLWLKDLAREFNSEKTIITKDETFDNFYPLI